VSFVCGTYRLDPDLSMRSSRGAGAKRKECASMPSYWTSLQNTAAYRLKELEKGENSEKSLRKELDALSRDLQVSCVVIAAW
jgi:hypothetical protein